MPSSDQLSFPASGGVSITGGGTTGNNQIASVAKIVNGQWTGTAFSGGAYFEAEVAFDPSLINKIDGWPSFWAMSVEHLAVLPEQYWPGQISTYEHYGEIDFLEYVTAAVEGQNTYGGNVHDWYGEWQTRTDESLPYAEVVRTVPADTDWTQFQKIGCLWVPATATTKGSLRWYFNDVQVGGVAEWDLFDPNSEPPPGAARFGIIDHHRMALILGLGSGQTMNVRRVLVWQSLR